MSLRQEWEPEYLRATALVGLLFSALNLTSAHTVRGEEVTQLVGRLKSAAAIVDGSAEEGFKVSIGPATGRSAFGELPRLAHLRWLILDADWITDDHMKVVGALSDLELLELHTPAVGDEGIAQIEKLERVFSLTFQSLKITDTGLGHLAGLKKLVYLKLAGCRGVRGPGLKSLRDLPKVHELILERNALTDEALVDLPHFPRLGTLIIHDERLSDAVLPQLKALTSRKGFDDLELFDTNITAEAIADLRRAAPGLVIVRANVAAGQVKLRRIGEALHKYRVQHGHFPPAVLTGPDGKTPYSWRVAMLPLLGEAAIFEQYRFNEPWDSPANQLVLKRMPDVYRAPGRTDHGYDASYFALTGPATLFADRDGVAIDDAKLTERFGWTVMIVETIRGIPWTKPEDIPYDDAQPVPNLGGLHEHGFSALCARGEPHFYVFDFPPKNEGWDEWIRAFLSTSGDEIWKRKIAKALTGKPAPDFTLKNLNDEEVCFSTLTRGRVALVSFCAVGCGPCRVEAPHLAKLYAKHKDEGLVVVTVNAWNESADMVRKYVTREKLSNIFLLDGKTIAKEKYLVQTYPTCCWIDHKGVIKQVDFGFSSSNAEALEKTASNLLAARKKDAR